jgi:hypothetical protein
MLLSRTPAAAPTGVIWTSSTHQSLAQRLCLIAALRAARIAL